MSTATAQRSVDLIVADFLEFMETQVAPPGLFTDDVFCDFTMPLWRMQARGSADVVALRTQGHAGPSTVTGWRSGRTPTGFVLEWQERWSEGGEEWTCREMAWAEVVDGAIHELSVYCTGDWDAARRAEHAEAVTLERP